MRRPRLWVLPQHPSPLAALGPGVTRAMVRTGLRTGSLLRLREGVYLAAAAWPDGEVEQHLTRARAEQVANRDAVLSHHSAALAWGLPSPPLTHWAVLPPVVTVPLGGRRSRTSATARVVEAPLPAGHVTRDAAGWLVTTVPRTAVDVAGHLDLPDALVVLDAAARLVCSSVVAQPRRRDYAAPALLTLVRKLLDDACAGRRGLAATKVAVGLVDPRRESPIESLTAGHIFLAGLPMPEFQAPIHTVRGTFYPDCYWKDHRLIGEADGAVKSAGPEAVLQEKEREQYLRDLGFGMVRWLGREITLRPEVVVERIARALRAAA